MKTLVMTTIAVAGLGLGCGADGPSTGPRLALTVSPLTLPDLDDACYTLAVTAGTAAQTSAGTAPRVWTRGGLCADRFGDGRGGLAYVGTCDASAPTNTVSLTLDRLCTGGSCDPSLTTDPNALPTDKWVNPCPAATPCRLEAPCVENADTPVTFNLTVMRDAGQGFFDIAINFDDVFCSAKFDCADAATGQPLELLFDGDARGPTAVLALACSAGVGSGVDTVLAMTDITLSCSDGTYEVIDPSAGDGGNVYTPSRDADLYQVAVYEGQEALLCDGAPCNKRYWNVAMGVRWDKLIARSVDCAFSARATVSSGLLVAGMTPAGWSYPEIDFDVPAVGVVAGTSRRALLCGSHGLNSDGHVTTRYVGPEAAGPFCSHFDGSSSERIAGCALPPDPCAGKAPGGYLRRRAARPVRGRATLRRGRRSPRVYAEAPGRRRRVPRRERRLRCRGELRWHIGRLSG